MHPYSSPTATQHPACGMVTSSVYRGEDLLCLERQHELAELSTQGKHGHPSHARQMSPSVNRQSSPKLLHAMVPKSDGSVQKCIHRNSCILALPMKSSRSRAMTPPSSSSTGGEVCAAGRQATAVRKAALWCSYAEQCNSTCYIDYMLFGFSQTGHMRSTMSWLAWSLNRLSC